MQKTGKNFSKSYLLLKAIKRICRKPWFYLAQKMKNIKLEQRKKQVKTIEKNGQIFYEYRSGIYPAYLNKGNAASFIEKKAKEYCKGRGIDVGSAKWPLSGAIAIENEEGQNAYRLDRFSDNSLDFIFSSHCLEHLDRWEEALKLWIKKIKINGILFLYLPHPSMALWRPGGPWVGYAHKWVPTYEILEKFLTKHGLEIIDYISQRDEYWSFYIVAKKKKKVKKR